MYYVERQAGPYPGSLHKTLAGQNVVAVGKRISARMQELQVKKIPDPGENRIQTDLQPTRRSGQVGGRGFIVSVGQAVAIVIMVLLLFMGLRGGLLSLVPFCSLPLQAHC